MPILANAKHEAFCQHRVAGHSQDEAYKLAGFKPSRQHAHRLATRGYIVDRIVELQQKSVERLEVTIDSMARQFDEDRQFAIACKKPSAAVAASVAKAKPFGLNVDRSVSKHTINTNYAQMTEEELMFELAGLHAELRAIKAGKAKVQQ